MGEREQAPRLLACAKGHKHLKKDIMQRTTPIKISALSEKLFDLLFSSFFSLFFPLFLRIC